jgi:hypothetical protein
MNPRSWMGWDQMDGNKVKVKVKGKGKPQKQKHPL